MQCEGIDCFSAKEKREGSERGAGDAEPSSSSPLTSPRPRSLAIAVRSAPAPEHKRRDSYHKALARP